MSQKKFKKIPFGNRKKQKQQQKRRLAMPSFCTKDVAINLQARKIVARRIEEVFEKKNYTKYPHGKKPYGFQTGTSMEEWKMDCKKLEDECDGFFDEELNRLSEVVVVHWINQPKIQSLLVRPLPIVIERRIQEFSATTYIFETDIKLIAFL